MPDRTERPPRTMAWAAAAALAIALATGWFLLRTRTLEAYPDQLAGIGIVVQADGEAHVIGKLVEGGPAAKAGLHVGDRILAIDGSKTEGESLAAVVAHLRGRPGSPVVLQVAGTEGPVIVTVTRHTLAKSGNGTYAPE